LASKCECLASMTGHGWNKLKTYKLFKYGIENYCKVLVPIYAFEKLRCENINLEERYSFNSPNLIEDEIHVILNCPVYSDFRNNLFTEVLKVNIN